MSDMNEAFEQWHEGRFGHKICHTFEYEVAWQAAWQARDAEVEEMKDELELLRDSYNSVVDELDKHAELVDALRVVGPFTQVVGDSARRLSPDSGQRVNQPAKWIVGEETEAKRSEIYHAIETINAAIRGDQ